MKRTISQPALSMPLVKPRPSRPMPIRMTPLIDVVFILLVFFMVTSYLLPTGYLELGNDTSTSRGGEGTPLPLLQLQASGEVRWNDRDWSVVELSQQLTRQGEREVRLATDGGVPLDSFTRTLSTLDNAGIKAHWKRTTPEGPSSPAP